MNTRMASDRCHECYDGGTGMRLFWNGMAGREIQYDNAEQGCTVCGFTPYYTCNWAVQAGYDDNWSFVTTGYPKNLWKAVMKLFMSDLKAKDLKSLAELHRLLSVQIPELSGSGIVSDLNTTWNAKLYGNILQTGNGSHREL